MSSIVSGLLPVLVIEDESCILSFLTTALNRGGVKVVGAASGSEALELLARGEFAGIVSDLRMPGPVDGRKVFEWVCRNRPALSERFLFITGDLSSPDAVEIHERTGVQFLEKPFRMAQMMELVRKIALPEGTSHA